MTFLADKLRHFTHDFWRQVAQSIASDHLKQAMPGVIAHRRHDSPCPARFALDLHRAWPEADVHLVEGAGHA